jgi:hypothetical protein
MHMAFQIPHVYDYIWRQQTQVIQNHENAHIRNIEQGETQHKKYKRLKLDGNQAYDCYSD